MKSILGIDIGGTYTRYGLVQNYEVLNVEKLLTSRIDDIEHFIVDLASKFKSNIDTISIGIPGITRNNSVISVPNITKLEFKDLAVNIESRTGIEVIINKDVTLLFLYDISRLKLSNSNIIGIYLGTGLGNSLLINNKLFKGDNGFAGELGHIPLIGNEMKCGCGKTGCAETIVSGKSLIGIHQKFYPKVEFKELFSHIKPNDELSKFIDNFVKIIAIEINIFDISTIIIGGGVPNMLDFPRAYILEQLKKELRSQILRDKLNIYFVDDNPVNGIYGSALAKGCDL